MTLWRESLGERGLRVVLFERRPGGPPYREVYVGGKRAATKKSLGHRDKERAVADAYRLLAHLKSRKELHSRERIALSSLFDIYVESPAHQAKKDRTRREDEQKLRWVVEFLGPQRDVRSITSDDVERYKQARMRGECGSRKRVGARTVAADLVAVQTMLNWGTRQRDGRAQPLLEFNPLRGLKLPAERNPKRPVETYDRYVKLMEVADEVDWRLPLALTLAESTGRRIGAILKLRLEDVDLKRSPHGWIRFRAEHDKTGHEQWVPISDGARRVLLEHRLRLSDSEWLFPSERKPGQPVDRSTMDRRLRMAYDKAELKPLDGGLWHPWRRKWATERKNMPLKDVALARGWRNTATLLQSYQQADEVTVSRVVLSAAKLTGKGVGGARSYPKTYPTAETAPAKKSAKPQVG